MVLPWYYIGIAIVLHYLQWYCTVPRLGVMYHWSGIAKALQWHAIVLHGM